MTGRAIRWFKGLAFAPKVLLVGSVALAMVLLKGLVLLIAVLLLAVRIVAVWTRASRRRPVRGWEILAVGSLVVILAYASVQNDSQENRATKYTKAAEQATEDRKKAAALQGAAYKPSPFGAVNQHLIKDLRVKDDTATVELEKLEGPGSRSRSWQAQSEALEGGIMCDSIASIAQQQRYRGRNGQRGERESCGGGNLRRNERAEDHRGQGQAKDRDG